MRYALIEDGLVANIAVADAEFAAEQGWIAAPEECAIGWAYYADEFTPVEESAPVPASVTPRQARLALLGAGLLDNVESALSALPSPQKDAALIEWEYASAILRESALVTAIGATLNLTSEQVDDLFRAAALL